MYKKLLSSALAVLMACVCFCVSVSAETPSLENVCKDAYINYLEADGATFEKLTYFDYFGDGGCLVFQASAFPGDPVEPQDVIGNYRFTAPMCMGYCDTNPAGMYAYNSGEVMTLREAYDNGLVDLDLLYENTDEKYKMSPLDEEKILINKCRAEYMEEFGIDKELEDEVYIYFAAKFDNYTVFRGTAGPSPALETRQYLDGYWFFEGAILGDEEDNPTGLYTLDNYGNVQPLRETVYEGFIDMDEVYPVLSEKCEMYMAGDIDNDKALTIKDATLIQKYLSNIPEAVSAVRNRLLGLFVINADLSGGVDESGADIRDVTYIQKKVAGFFDYEERPPFAYNEIIVSFYHTDVPEYTLEDFPEYEFKSIEINRLDAIKMVMIILEIEEDGKDGVIKAVNSLKYREGTEFDSVHPNWLAYSD